MKIFLFDEYSKGKLEKICESTGSEVIKTDTMQNSHPFLKEGTFFLDSVDLLIIEITHISQMMYFVLAQAILVNKPTLCVYKKNKPPREVLYYIRKRKAPRPIKTFSYTDKDIKTSIQHFVNIHDPHHAMHDTKPSIKYTLRLTPTIERYLDWMSKQQGKTKADLIRFMLEESALRDYDYTDPEGDR